MKNEWKEWMWDALALRVLSLFSVGAAVLGVDPQSTMYAALLVIWAIFWTGATIVSVIGRAAEPKVVKIGTPPRACEPAP